jgi:hypothetical protein
MVMVSIKYICSVYMGLHVSYIPTVTAVKLVEYGKLGFLYLSLPSVLQQYGLQAKHANLTNTANVSFKLPNCTKLTSYDV